MTRTTQTRDRLARIEADLARIEANFAAAITHPLDPSSGTFTATPAHYPATSVAPIADTPTLAAAPRPALHNRQYPVRPSTVLQNLYPLTARLFGYFHFNRIAADFLTAHPPRDTDIAAIGFNFAPWLRRQRNHPSAFFDAADLDAAYQRVFVAPPVTPAPLDTAATTRPLRLTDDAALVTESCALLALRNRLASLPGEHPLDLPAPHPHPVTWLITRSRDFLHDPTKLPARIDALALTPVAAALYPLVLAHPLEKALATLEKNTPPAARKHLTTHVRDAMETAARLQIFARSP